MALSDTIEPKARLKFQAERVYPVGLQSDWAWACNAPATADNAGSEVLNPGALSREALRRLRPAGAGTTMMICLRYDDGATISTAPVVQPFGFDINNVPHRLRDADGTHAITLSAAATDVHDGTYKYTDWVEVDMDGAWEVMVAIKTALAVSAGSTDGAEILVKFK